MKNLLLIIAITCCSGIQAFSQCHAGFNWEQIPNTLTIHFINTSTSEHDITSYQWNFGDGSMGDGQNPNHTYAAPGVYLVCLIIHDSEGCVSDVCHEVVVEGGSNECEAAFEWEQVSNSLTIHFINQSSSPHDIISYQWNFGDGHTGDGQHPNHTYEEPGTYLVCLIIHDAVGCVSDVCHEVVVAGGSNDCEAEFEWEQVNNSLTIHFINQSTSPHDIISYQWNFGDGHTGDGQNPNHTYEHSGTYLVCLIIHDSEGCVSDVCHEVHVEGVSNDCEAAFEWEQVNNSLTIHFINQSTSPHDIISYLWNFGDGHMGDGANPNHTYEHAGTYVVCLIIHDAVGCVSDVCHEVHVEGGSSECEAAFEWEQVNNSLTIHFINHSSSPNDIISYQWNFGDGHMGDGQNPNHTYEHPGVYLVCLIIHDSEGCASDVCHEVVVEGGSGECEAAFEWEQANNSLTVHFINHSSSPHDIVSYQWNFGDGHMGDGQNPHHTYEHPGTYLVCLIIHDAVGCVSDVCHEVLVEGGSGECEASFTWDQIDSLTIHFNSTSTSQHDIISYQWNFGDGHMGDGPHPTHTYEEAGVYLVCLIITDAAGCVSDVCLEIAATSPAQGEASFEFTVSKNGNVFFFHNHSTPMNEHIVWFWNFGDGETSTAQNPHHHFTGPGQHEVCLTMLNTQTFYTDQYCITVSSSAVSMDLYTGFAPEPGSSSSKHFSSDLDNLSQVSYTNPVKDEMKVQFTLDQEASVRMELFDITGKRMIWKQLDAVAEGIHEETLSTGSIVPGIYSFQLSTGNQQVVRMILVVQ